MSEKTGAQKIFTLSASALKTIALLTMFIDHFGYTVVNEAEHRLHPDIGATGPFTEAMRLIGRIAFILFAFLLVEGFANTSNRKKYVLRLLAGAIISEIPFDLAASSKYFDPWDQNVFFTLSIGFCTVWMLEVLRKRAGEKQDRFSHMMIPLKILTVIAGMVLAELVRCDYGCLGVGLIVVFYLFRWHSFRFWAALIWCYIGHILEDFLLWLVGLYKYSLRTGQTFSLQKVINWDSLTVNLSKWAQNRMIYTMSGILTALLLIQCYNGEKGRQLPKAFYYLFYPVHLLLLYVAMRVMR